MSCAPFVRDTATTMQRGRLDVCGSLRSNKLRVVTHLRTLSASAVVRTKNTSHDFIIGDLLPHFEIHDSVSEE